MTTFFTVDHLLAPLDHNGPWSEFEEHGLKWLECFACGAQWSIDLGETTLEQVSEGDGYCQDNPPEED